MARSRVLMAAALLLLGSATPALADLTGMIGVTTTPANRMMKGFAVGAGMAIVGFEFEFATTSEDLEAQAPSLTTGMGNLLLQTPMMVFGIQPYITGGAGIYRESLGAVDNLSVGFNTGGGAKIKLAGPVRLRVDYRALSLGGGALYSPAHRIYLGLNLKF